MVPGSNTVTVLAVVCKTDLEQLRRIFAHSRWVLMEAASIAEAAKILRLKQRLVVICNPLLPDGGWRRLLQHMQRYSAPTPLVVAASQADDALWMEVLESGAYNLLGVPFQESEVFRVLSNAWLEARQPAGKFLTA